MGFIEDLNEAFPPGTEAARDVLRTAHEVAVAQAEAEAAAAAKLAQTDAETKLAETKADFERRESALQAANQALAMKIGVAPGVIAPTQEVAKPEVSTLAELKAKALGKTK